MSSFVTPENKRPTNPQLANLMVPDALEGFKTEVANNRIAYALRYLVNILEILDDERTAKPAKAAANKAASTPASKTKATAEVDE